MAETSKSSLLARLVADVVNDPVTLLRGSVLQSLIRDFLDGVPYRGVGNSADPSGTIYKADGSGLISPSAMTENSDRVSSTKSIETPPGSLIIGGVRVSSGLNTLAFRRAGGAQLSLISMVPYDENNGSDTPIFYDLAAQTDFPVTTVFDTQLSQPLTFVLVPAIADNIVTKFQFRPAEAGTLIAEGFTGGDVSGDPVFTEEITVDAGQIGSLVSMDLSSPILTLLGDQVTLRVSGIDVFGGVQTEAPYTGQTLPFLTLQGHLITRVEYTSPNTLTSHLAERATDNDAAAGAAVRDLLSLLTGDNRFDASHVKGIPDIPDQARLHFTSATFNSATRTLTFTRDNGSTLDVVIPESTSGFLAPRITEFALPDTASRIGTTENLIGDLNLQFHVSESANINNLSLLANGVNVGAIATFTPDGLITATVNISSAEWTLITTADNTQVAFQLSGTDKDTPAGTVTSNIVTVQIADVPASEFFYYGISSSNNPASVDVLTLNSLEAAAGTFTLNPIDPGNGDWIILLAPQDHDLTALVNVGINQNELPLFTQTVGVRTINGQAYNSYVLGPTNDTVPVTWRATLG